MLTIALALLGCKDEVPVDTPTPTTTPPPTVPQDTIPDVGAPAYEALLGGTFMTLPAFEGVADVSGTALLMKKLDGYTEVSIALSGIVPSTEHSVHVHVWPCSYEGGGHYKLDPDIEDQIDTNEIWPNVTADVDGNGTAWVSVDHWTRGDALSVVVHDPVTTEKMACADLAPGMAIGATASGTFAPFADYELVDEKISGTASAVIGSTTTTIDVNFQGLDDLSTYTAHVHQQPCDVLYASGHYKLDPTIDVTDEYNELWPEILPAGGIASDSLTAATHALREDAQAVVLHRDAPKVACADLTRESYTGLRLTGSVYNLPDADGKGLTVSGTAALERRMDATTVVELDVTGLPPSATHPVHVHDKPCDVADGGAHYVIDAAAAEGEDNEIWPSVTVDANGAGTRAIAVSHLARADAQSLVIHDAADAARLACVDLY